MYRKCSTSGLVIVLHNSFLRKFPHLRWWRLTCSQTAAEAPEALVQPGSESWKTHEYMDKQARQVEIVILNLKVRTNGTMLESILD